jgi:hypothetical protein
LMTLTSLLNLTTNWKSAIDIEATIYSNAWKVVGANCAPSEMNLPIIFNNLLQKMIETVFAVIDLEYPTICMRDLLAVCTPSNVGLHFELIISLWRRQTLKWGAAPCWKPSVVCRFAFAFIQSRLEMAFDIQLTDATTNWNVEEGLSLKDLFDLQPKGKALIDLLAVDLVFAWWSIKLKNCLKFESALMLMKSWCWKSLKSKSNMMLLKNWRWRSLKSNSALKWMKIWDQRSLKSKSAMILFVKATGTHTNDAKVLHETFVAKVTGSLANNAKALNKLSLLK